MKTHEAVEVPAKQLQEGELRKAMQKDKKKVLLESNKKITQAKETIKELKEAKEKLDPDGDRYVEVVQEIDKTIKLYESRIKELQNARKGLD